MLNTHILYVHTYNTQSQAPCPCHLIPEKPSRKFISPSRALSSRDGPYGIAWNLGGPLYHYVLASLVSALRTQAHPCHNLPQIKF